MIQAVRFEKSVDSLFFCDILLKSKYFKIKYI